jgi:three-Cys-motif partner protein
MDKNFFANKFDDATILKLKIFRQYLREWLPVFMTQRKYGQRQRKHVHIYDFFAGPGKDSAGNPGSPLIIVDEIKRYCANNSELRTNTSVRMVFNDVEKRYIATLQNSVKEVACDQSCCEFEFKALPFQKALSHYLEDINNPLNASLVIMINSALRKYLQRWFSFLCAAALRISFFLFQLHLFGDLSKRLKSEQNKT